MADKAIIHAKPLSDALGFLEAGGAHLAKIVPRADPAVDHVASEEVNQSYAVGTDTQARSRSRLGYFPCAFRENHDVSFENWPLAA